MPDTFHGKGKLTLSSWLVHFGIGAEINGWDEKQTATYMALSLRDEALVAFMESIPGRTELTATKEKLTKLFAKKYGPSSALQLSLKV